MQGELFGLNSTGSVLNPSRPRAAQPNWMDRFHMTLRLDHLAILAISALVLYVLVFSFGVEKGKRIALKEIRSERLKQRQMTQELFKAQPLKEPVELKAPPLASETPSGEVRLAKYTIQLITFNSRKRAEEEVKRLQEKGFSSFIISAGKFFQVCVETFEKMVDAKDKLIQLRQSGYAPQDAYIRPLAGQISF